jgi:hypothetical protein
VVYRLNAHVVQYNFEGLVLLAAVAPDGRELPDGDPALPQLAQRLGVTMAAPCLRGTWGELVAELGRTPAAAGGSAVAGSGSRQEGSGSSRPRAVSGPPAFEGWVLTTADCSRHKLISEQYKQASLAGQALHPLSVWDAVRCSGLSRAALLAGLPAHFQDELRGILDALTRRFCWVQQQLAAQLEGGRSAALGVAGRAAGAAGQAGGAPAGRQGGGAAAGAGQGGDGLGAGLCGAHGSGSGRRRSSQQRRLGGGQRQLPARAALRPAEGQRRRRPHVPARWL